MATMTVADAKNHFSDVLRRAEHGGERVIVERHGKPVAVIVSTDDLKRLESLEDATDVRDARAALTEADADGTIPLDVVLRKHGLDHLIQPKRPSPRHPANSTRTGRRKPRTSTPAAKGRRR